MEFGEISSAATIEVYAVIMLKDIDDLVDTKPFEVFVSEKSFRNSRG